MRQKMVSNEIIILRDTFRRLLRRKANTNLTKLIEKPTLLIWPCCSDSSVKLNKTNYLQ